MASLPRLFRSLTVRLAVLSAVWVSVGLGAAGCMVQALITVQLTESFDGRAHALLSKVAGAAGYGPDHQPELNSDVPVPEFQQPFSGYYWQMETSAGRAVSRSLWDGRISPAGSVRERGSPAMRDGMGPRDEPLRIAEREITPAGEEVPILIRVGLSRKPLDEQIASFRILIISSFAIIGVGLVAGGTIQLIWGMRPLRQARRELAGLRAGQQATLSHATAPSEIAPLLNEIDALVKQNRDTVERARSHVGNLAHAMKTPLAVQRMALEPGSVDYSLAREQTRAMEMLLQHHLSRARSAALLGAAAVDSSALHVAQNLATALHRIFANKDLELDVKGDATLCVRVERQDLTEMLGNVLENACQWARHQVTLEVSRCGGHILITVTDDGPGVATEEHDMVLARGIRLDEAKPGSGLGLAITRDLVALYGGELLLREADPGGLMVQLSLPAGMPAAHSIHDR
jgi:signal transduction histidine kinase